MHEKGLNMVVQHNLTAINSNRQFGITTARQAKSSEKLSSGYKVNRAADDAAGLSISEKMRRQIRGLTQASANAQDGISFVQVADGALNEVHDMLHRGNELAVKAANGTLSDTDRKAIDAEIKNLKEEINAVGARTKFNDIPIFLRNGSTGQSSDAKKALANIIANEYIPTAVSQIVSKLSNSIGGKLIDSASNPPIADAYGMKLDITYIDGLSKTLASMGAAFYPFENGYDLFKDGSLLMKVDEDDFKSANLSPELQQKLESTIAHELMHGVMDILLPEGMSTNNDSDNMNFPKWFKEGTAQLIGGGFTTGWNDSIAIIAKSSMTEADKTAAISSYLNDGTFSADGRDYTAGGTFTVEGREYGHGYLACAYICQLASGESYVNQESLIKGADILFNALMLNEQNYKNGATDKKSFEGVINNVIGGSGKNLSNIISEINNGFSAAVDFVLKLANACNSGGSSFGAGSLIASGLNSTSILGPTVTSKQAMYVTNIETGSAEENDEIAANTILYLHIGADSTRDNKVELERFALSAAALGLERTDTLTAQTSLEAISQFSEAVSKVSYMRAYFGALQNRLEHTIKNLDNVVENTTAAESLIRDTDMAKEMVRYSNNNILMQAGQSVLAQANQTNQAVLALLQ